MNVYHTSTDASTGTNSLTHCLILHHMAALAAAAFAFATAVACSFAALTIATASRHSTHRADGSHAHAAQAGRMTTHKHMQKQVLPMIKQLHPAVASTGIRLWWMLGGGNQQHTSTEQNSPSCQQQHGIITIIMIMWTLLQPCILASKAASSHRAACH